MTNELIFLVQIITIGTALLAALRMGKEYVITFIALQAIFANVLISKQITLFGLSVTATDAFSIGIIIGLNLLQEYWSKEAARTALVLSFATSVLSSVLMYIHLSFIPSVTDNAHAHFYALFSTTPRIIAASLFSYFVSQTIDYYFFGLLRTRCGHIPLVIRSFMTTSISQLLDTMLFTLLALYGNVASVQPIILFSFSIKIIALLLSTPFVMLSKKYAQSGVQSA
jgi:hypothetical protein